MYAFNKSSTTVTNEAMITINAGIRTLSGIIFRSMEINILLSARTTIVVSPIPRPLMADVVTARVGHIPSINTKVGFSKTIPFTRRSDTLFCFIADTS